MPLRDIILVHGVVEFYFSIRTSDLVQALTALKSGLSKLTLAPTHDEENSEFEVSVAEHCKARGHT